MFGEFGVSTAVGQVASDEVSKSVYSGLRNEGMNNTMASGISGAAGGATFAGTAGLTTLGIQKGTQLARSAMSSLEKSDEAEEGVEMGELGLGEEGTEAAELGGEVIEGLELGGEVGETLGPVGAIAGLAIGAGLGFLFGVLDPPTEKKTQEEPQRESLADLEEKFGEKTGIWSKNTIVPQKQKFNISRFKINQDAIDYQKNVNPTMKPVVDNPKGMSGNGNIRPI